MGKKNRLCIRKLQKIKSLKKLLRFIPVYTPSNVPETKAIKAEIKTNSKVAGNLSDINSETGLLNWYEIPKFPFEAFPTNLVN